MVFSLTEHIPKARLSYYTFKYDQRQGRRQLGVLPTEMAKLLPGAFSTFTLPVLLPDGSRSRVEGVPNIDWTYLFAHAVVVTQAWLGMLWWSWRRRCFCPCCCCCLLLLLLPLLVAVVMFVGGVCRYPSRLRLFALVTFTMFSSRICTLSLLRVCVTTVDLLAHPALIQELNGRYDALDTKMDVLKAETENGE